MVGTDLKAEAMKLVEKREGVEAEMNSIIHRLCQPGGPGLAGNLVDSEGFPRADIDVPIVRAERHRLAELKTDHRDLTEKINQNIQLLHATKPSPRTSTVMDSENFNETSESVQHVRANNADDADANVKIPFAMVDEITEASPAADDGLQLGDQIVKFGNVEAGDNLLTRLASEVQVNQGNAVFVVVMRQGALTSLSVTPRAWEGRGLLGCHFRLL